MVDQEDTFIDYSEFDERALRLTTEAAVATTAIRRAEFWLSGITARNDFCAADVRAFRMVSVDVDKGTETEILPAHDGSDASVRIAAKRTQRSVDADGRTVIWLPVRDAEGRVYGQLALTLVSESNASTLDIETACTPVLKKLTRATLLHIKESVTSSERCIGKVLNRQDNRWRKALQSGCGCLCNGLPGVRAVLFFGRVYGNEDKLALVEGAPAHVVHDISSSRHPTRVSSRLGIAGLAYTANTALRVRVGAIRQLSNFAKQHIEDWRLMDLGKELWSDREFAVMAIPAYAIQAGVRSQRPVGVFTIGRAPNVNTHGFWACEELVARHVIDQIMGLITSVQLKEDAKHAANVVSGVLGLRDDEREKLYRWTQLAEGPELQILMKHYAALQADLNPVAEVSRTRSFIRSTGLEIRRPAPPATYFAVEDSGGVR